MGSVKQSRTLDTTLVAIASHPLRTRCLTVLAEGTASPKGIADQLGEDISDVSYHVKQLMKMGAVELVDMKPVRGAIQHFYRAVVRPMVSDEEFAALSIEERTQFAQEMLQLSVADATTALATTSFVQRPDPHFSRNLLRLDEEGWKELGEIYAEALQRTEEVAAASAERLGEDPEAPGIDARVVSMVFEMPGQPDS